MFVLQDQQKLRLAIMVPEAVAAYIKPTTNISFTVKGLANEKFTAFAKRFAGSLDTRLRAERIEMDIINKDRKLLPGMVAEVYIPTAAIDSGFIVPKTAMVNSSEKIFVIRITNGKAQWIDVKNGREADGKVEVYGALSVGDTLVLRASEEKRNGSAVEKLQLTGSR
jgi:multidrug efflux pump subunit AcrA (membrane-fusion protein)